MTLPQRGAGFVEPTECLIVPRIPEGSLWTYEIKLDGYRAVAVKSSATVSLYSRRKKSFNSQYPQLIDALDVLPNDTVVDGEVVASTIQVPRVSICSRNFESKLGESTISFSIC